MARDTTLDLPAVQEVFKRFDPMGDTDAYQRRLSEALASLPPDLPYITSIVMAGDLVSAVRSDALVEAGASFDDALSLVGSYARLDWALRAQERGLTTRDHLLDLLPDLWRGSDPDDTDPRFLTLWLEAFKRNGRKPLCDDVDLPNQKVLRVYRGQDEGVKPGIAWSLDQKVAEKFAQGAGMRVRGRPHPVMYVANVERRRVLGYLTLRREAEVVVSPFDLRSAEV